MTLLIETPPGYAPERDFIFGVLLEEFLGLDWRRQTGERDNVRITLAGEPRGGITLPDVLFKTPGAQWLSAESLPAMSLPIWDSSDLGLPITLIDPKLPVIYGDPSPWTRQDKDEIHLPVDIFGSAFYMLSRYEEIAVEDRDEHDRFPARASLAYKAGFLERPIVDEYVEVLWAAMASLWPGLNRKKRIFQLKVSHDVDRPARYQFTSTRQLLLALGGDVIKRRNWQAPLKAARVRFRRGDRLHPADPFNTFDWIMDVSEQHGLTSAFYFICGGTHARFDADYDPGHPAIRALMRRIYERGHEIGLHPSYNTYRDPAALTQEMNTLRTICETEGIEQTRWGGRMHYLRWDPAITLPALNATGLAYDSTLGYADHAGFRCGTCHEYPAFDLLKSLTLRLRLRPLIVMESAVLGGKDMGLSDVKARDHLTRLRDCTFLLKGTFTLLWHNSELVSRRLRQVYKEIFGTYR